MLFRFYIICINLLIFTKISQQYVLLTANVEDLKRIARKFLSESLVGQIADILEKARTDYEISNENERNVKDFNAMSYEIGNKHVDTGQRYRNTHNERVNKYKKDERHNKFEGINRIKESSSDMRLKVKQYPNPKIRYNENQNKKLIQELNPKYKIEDDEFLTTTEKFRYLKPTVNRPVRIIDKIDDRDADRNYEREDTERNRADNDTEKQKDERDGRIVKADDRSSQERDEYKYTRSAKTRMFRADDEKGSDGQTKRYAGFNIGVSKRDDYDEYDGVNYRKDGGLVATSGSLALPRMVVN